jgi:hypothetical protein
VEGSGAPDGCSEDSRSYDFSGPEVEDVVAAPSSGTLITETPVCHPGEECGGGVNVIVKGSGVLEVLPTCVVAPRICCGALGGVLVVCAQYRVPAVDIHCLR